MPADHKWNMIRVFWEAFLKETRELERRSLTIEEDDSMLIVRASYRGKNNKIEIKSVDLVSAYDPAHWGEIWAKVMRVTVACPPSATCRE